MPREISVFSSSNSTSGAFEPGDQAQPLELVARVPLPWTSLGVHKK